VDYPPCSFARQNVPLASNKGSIKRIKQGDEKMDDKKSLIQLVVFAIAFSISVTFLIKPSALGELLNYLK
jgi:hypothetical protein